MSGNRSRLVLALACLAATVGGAALAQRPCDARNLRGTWKLISEESVVEPSAELATAEYLELRSGLLFWIVQTEAGERHRERHKLFFAGSTLDVRPPLDKAPQVTRCTVSGRRLVLLTASFTEDNALRRGRLEFQKTGS